VVQGLDPGWRLSKKNNWRSFMTRTAQLVEAAVDLQHRGEDDKALTMFKEAYEQFRARGDEAHAADALRHIGSIYRERGDTDVAERFYRESLSAAERASYTLGVAHALNWLAVIQVRRGDLAAAEAGFCQASELATQSSDHRLVGMIEQNLGVLANIRGDIGAALLRYRSALNAFRQLEDKNMIAAVLNNVGLMETELKHWEAAEAAFTEAHAAASATANVATLNSIELNTAELAAARSRWKVVEASSRRAVTIARKRRDRVSEAEALRFSGMAARERGAFDSAESDLLEAHTLACDVDDMLLQAHVTRELGVLYGRLSRTAEARAALLRSLELFSTLGASLEEAAVQDMLEGVARN
jgi:tetratricopeptide (TPR) repeat protein